jgi:hypothetical protein
MKTSKFLMDAAEVVAFQVPDAPHTPRRGLAAIAANPELIAECVPVFGQSFEQLSAGLSAHGLLDIEFQPEPV